jgi:hypothetical protein
MENKVVFYETEEVKVYKTDERDMYLVVGADFECKLTGNEIVKYLWQ